jgi:hypothetical protein
MKRFTRHHPAGIARVLVVPGALSALRRLLRILAIPASGNAESLGFAGDPDRTCKLMLRLCISFAFHAEPNRKASVSAKPPLENCQTRLSSA